MAVRTLAAACAALALLGAACAAELADAVHLQQALKDTYGAASDPQVSLVNGEKKLRVRIEGPHFAALPDSAAERTAREVAVFVIRHYGHQAELDTVAVSLVISRTGPARMTEDHAFAAAALR
jgi:hypothetical protein